MLLEEYESVQLRWNLWNMSNRPTVLGYVQLCWNTIRIEQSPNTTFRLIGPIASEASRGQKSEIKSADFLAKETSCNQLVF